MNWIILDFQNPKSRSDQTHRNDMFSIWFELIYELFDLNWFKFTILSDWFESIITTGGSYYGDCNRKQNLDQKELKDMCVEKWGSRLCVKFFPNNASSFCELVNNSLNCGVGSLPVGEYGKVAKFRL